MAVTSRPPVTTYLPGGSGNTGCSMMRPCSSSHQSEPSNLHCAGATPSAFNASKLLSRTPRGPGSSGHRPHDSAPTPEVAAGSPNAAMNCVGIGLIVVSASTGLGDMSSAIASSAPIVSLLGVSMGAGTLLQRCLHGADIGNLPAGGGAVEGLDRGRLPVTRSGSAGQVGPEPGILRALTPTLSRCAGEGASLSRLAARVLGWIYWIVLPALTKARIVAICSAVKDLVCSSAARVKAMRAGMSGTQIFSPGKMRLGSPLRSSFLLALPSLPLKL